MTIQTKIIYNVTLKVNTQIAKDWLSWLKDEHIPAVLATGCFTHAQIVRLIETDDTEGPTYAVQYHAKEKEDYHTYLRLHAEKLRQESFTKWGNQFIAFRSLMEVVN